MGRIGCSQRRKIVLQVSVVQSRPSSQSALTAHVVHIPDTQAFVGVMQRLPQLPQFDASVAVFAQAPLQHCRPLPQDTPFGAFEVMQPPGLHASIVQGLPSSGHPPEPPVQAPEAEHVVPVVQGSPSSQEMLGVIAELHAPLVGLHVSIVHGLPSLQLRGVDRQLPPEHRSPSVQASPSSHSRACGVLLQRPSVGLQSSSVH